MTKAQADGTRRRTVHFADALLLDEQDALRSAIAKFECTTKVEVNDLQLMVEYDFPACCFGEIWQLVIELVNTHRMKFVERLRHSIAGFAEQNERDHRLYPRHWHTYLKDIHAHYYNYKHDNSSATHKHLWRRYQRKP